MKLLLTLALLFTAQLANAQQTIIESLKTQRAGEGRVTIHQDAQNFLIDRQTLYTRYNPRISANTKITRIPGTGICRKQLTPGA